jgi:hypothetical protein
MAKLYLKSVESHLWSPMVNFLTIGNLYEGDLTPVIYDPHTLQPAEPSYIVKCDDDKCRIVDAKYFMTLEEFREQKINKILK